MPEHAQFRGFLNTVIESQEAEINLGRQPALINDGKEVRMALSALPPEVTKPFLAEYRPIPPALIQGMEEAIMSRELALENASQGKNLDKEWAAGGGGGRVIDETNLGGDDAWNEPSDPGDEW